MSANTGMVTLPEVEEMSLADGQDMVRREVSDKLGISLDEFFSKLDAGDFDGTEDDSIFRIVMMAPFAR